MEIYINGSRADVTLENEKTLGEVMSALEAEIEKADGALEGFSVNGVEVSVNDSENTLSKDISKVGRLDLRVVSAKGVAESVAAACEKIAPRVELMCASLCDIGLDYETGKDAAAAGIVKEFSELVETLMSYYDLLPHSKVTFNLSEWNGLLKDFAQAVADGDAVAAGDLAEYELSPRLKQLFEAIKLGATT